MVTMGDYTYDFQPGCLADRLALGQHTLGNKGLAYSPRLWLIGFGACAPGPHTLELGSSDISKDTVPVGTVGRCGARGVGRALEAGIGCPVIGDLLQ